MKKLAITPDCEFFILASDDLWNKVSNEEAVDMTRDLCVDEGFSNEACRRLVDVVVRREGNDDVTIMIVNLKHFCT